MGCRNDYMIGSELDGDDKAGLAELLCGACRLLEKSGVTMTESLAAFWKLHQAVDSSRLLKEQAYDEMQAEDSKARSQGYRLAENHPSKSAADRAHKDHDEALRKEKRFLQLVSVEQKCNKSHI